MLSRNTLYCHATTEVLCQKRLIYILACSSSRHSFHRYFICTHMIFDFVLCNTLYDCNFVSHAQRWIVTVSMVTDISLPQISISKNKTVEFGDDVTLQCNLTRTGNNFVTLVTMAWIKDGESVTRVPRPAEIKLRDISMMIDRPQDGGYYQCKLTTVLHQQRMYNITKLVIVKGGL